MTDDQSTGTLMRERFGIPLQPKVHGLLVAHAPPGVVGKDRHEIDGTLQVGRGEQVQLRLLDDKVSRVHFRVQVGPAGAVIQEAGSKNGTFVNGARLDGQRELADGDVIRVGRSVLVYSADARRIIRGYRPPTGEFRGEFHAPLIVKKVSEAALSGRSVLITGPTGAGKELAAGAVAAFEDKPMVVQNAARFSTEDEAMSSLFGVGEKIFSFVRAREGFIERAEGGILFIDEAHMLPLRVQKALLRVIEDKLLVRIGESRERPVNVRFVLATNEPGPDHGLAHDLLARTRVFEIPPLVERRADIPAIFEHLLTRAVEQQGISKEQVIPLISADHHEALMNDGFKEQNARGLLDIADRIATRIKSGSPPAEAIYDIFARRFQQTPDAAPEPVPYSQVPELVTRSTLQDISLLGHAHIAPEQACIQDAYLRHGGNVAGIHRDLAHQGHKISRRRIAKLLDKLGLPRVNRG